MKGRHRALFTSFDLLLLVAALLVMSIGFSRRQAVWMNGQAEKRKGSMRHLLAYLISHRAVLKRRPAGMAHLFLFWGGIVFVVVVVAAQFDFKLLPALSGVEVVAMIADPHRRDGVIVSLGERGLLYVATE